MTAATRDILASPLLTDLYQVTMAYSYWKLGRADQRAVFHLFFRRNPFDGGYAVVAGLDGVLTFLRESRFTPDDLDYLRQQTGTDGQPLFDDAFLDYLRDLRWSVDLDAMPEGTVAFAPEPVLRVTGPLAQAQLLETALLNLINFQTLVATKAARVCFAAGGDPVLEFGLRRAQGVDGGMAASRASYIGGCHATSNVLAGQRFGIPIKGTHAHSWVMAFDDEDDAFTAWADTMPGNCILLVDTYDTLEGVRKAAEVGRRMQQRGQQLDGIRLDSGDLAYLSSEARKILDEAGLHDAKIVASSDLDEHLIANLKQQDAKIDIWGVGTRLATAYDQPALGGVYKLAAIERDAKWQRVIKVSDNVAKSTTPGIQGVRRFAQDDRFVADAIYDIEAGVPEPTVIVDPADHTRRKAVPKGLAVTDLLEPAVREGNVLIQTPALDAIRERTLSQLASLHPAIKRLVNPHPYPAGLELGLHDRKTQMILETRRATAS